MVLLLGAPQGAATKEVNLQGQRPPFEGRAEHFTSMHRRWHGTATNVLAGHASIPMALLVGVPLNAATYEVNAQRRRPPFEGQCYRNTNKRAPAISGHRRL